MTSLLSIQGLHLEAGAPQHPVALLRGVDLELARGRTLGLVGESGSGKSLTALSVLGLLGSGVRRVAGSIRLESTELTTLGEREFAAVRGGRIGMIFQNPLTALNPALTVGTQLMETLRTHRGLSRRAARDRATELLDLVGIPRAKERLREYPHQFSGGMRQRVMIAMAVSCEPDLLIADEPTTALDVTVQAQILELLRDLVDRTGAGLVLVTHDLGVVAEMADDVAVMYAGRIVERGAARQVLTEPSHPYALALLRSIPRHDQPGSRLEAIAGEPPLPGAVGGGCPFAPRCAFALDRCASEAPPLVTHAGRHGHDEAECWVELPAGRPIEAAAA